MFEGFTSVITSQCSANGKHITPLADLFEHELSQLPVGNIQPGLYPLMHTNQVQHYTIAIKKSSYIIIPQRQNLTMQIAFNYFQFKESIFFTRSIGLIFLEALSFIQSSVIVSSKQHNNGTLYQSVNPKWFYVTQ